MIPAIALIVVGAVLILARVLGSRKADHEKGIHRFTK